MQSSHIVYHLTASRTHFPYTSYNETSENNFICINSFFDTLQENQAQLHEWQNIRHMGHLQK